MKKKLTITLEINKDLFAGDSVHLFINDKVIEINGTIPDSMLRQTVGEKKLSIFIIKQVNDEQINFIKEHLVEIVSPKRIKESKKMLFTDIESSTRYERIKVIIVYKNSIYQINRISILKRNVGIYSIVLGIT